MYGAGVGGRPAGVSGGGGQLDGTADKAAAARALESAGLTDELLESEPTWNTDAEPPRRVSISSPALQPILSTMSLHLGASDAFDDDDGHNRVAFDAFQNVMGIDPWKATTARLFVTLGGDPTDPLSSVPLAAAGVDAVTRAASPSAPPAPFAPPVPPLSPVFK